MIIMADNSGHNENRLPRGSLDADRAATLSEHNSSPAVGERSLRYVAYSPEITVT